MTVKAQIASMVDLVPEHDLPILLEVIRRFVPASVDDVASPDDIAAHKIAVQEYAEGETISHNAIHWD